MLKWIYSAQSLLTVCFVMSAWGLGGRGFTGIGIHITNSCIGKSNEYAILGARTPRGLVHSLPYKLKGDPKSSQKTVHSSQGLQVDKLYSVLLYITGTPLLRWFSEAHVCTGVAGQHFSYLSCDFPNDSSSSITPLLRPLHAILMPEKTKPHNSGYSRGCTIGGSRLPEESSRTQTFHLL